jgi:hypothetical protein
VLGIAERVAAKQVGFKVGERLEAVVVRPVLEPHVLLDDERQEETELGDERRERLDVEAVEIFLNEAEFAEIVVTLALHAPRSVGADGGGKTREQPLLPAFIIRVNAGEQVDHAMQHAHRKRARTARGVKHADRIHRFHNAVGDGGKINVIWRFVAEARKQLKVVRACAVLLEPGTQMQVQRLVDHVIHDAARRVV